MSWRHRRHDIDALLPEIAELVQRHLADVEEVCKTRLAKRDPGYLLDLADFALDRVPERAVRSFQRLPQLRLQTDKDFDVFHTLSEQSSLGTSVKIVNCRSLGSSKRVYAVKTMTKSCALRFETQTSLSRERDILQEALRSKRQDVVQIVCAAQDGTTLSVVLEYLPAGDIGLVLEERKTVPEAWAKHWIAQAIKALSWLHGIGYTHRDVKPSNILLTLQGNAKLADFGSAAPTLGGYVVKKYTMTPVGTVDYIAPEVLLAHQAAVEEDSLDRTMDMEGRGGYGVAVDWWSLGVSLYEMVSGNLPFYADSIPQTYEKIIEHKSLAQEPLLCMSTACKDLLKTLLVSASERPSVSDIQQHRFFREIDWKNLGHTPGPLKPVIRQLIEKDQSSLHEPASKAFDFSALFSSPGLSILRPEASDVTHSFDLRWAGFTLLPKAGEFDSRLDDVPSSKLLQQTQAIADESVPAAAFPFTPARRSASPSAVSSSNRRNLQNATALKEVVNYGILKTAKKASAATVRRERQTQSTQKPDVSDLEQRHKGLLHEINNIERRYRDLVASTKNYTDL